MANKKQSPPLQDYHRALGIVLLQGPRGALFRMSEVPLRPARGAAVARRRVGALVQGPGFRVQGSGFRVQGSWFRVQGSGFRVQGSGFRGQG